MSDIIENFQLNVPIIFIIFNRKDTTQKVFDVIKKVKPPILLVVADGARKEKDGEEQKVTETRKIIEQVDWDCKILTNYSDVNLGCKKRVSSGLDWAFSVVDKAIILEDDCLATLSFFKFTQEMLEKYNDDERIMMISGDNKTFCTKEIDESYYFSRQIQIWGWATWSRAWKKYDIEMKDWPKIKKQKFINQFCQKKSHQYYWKQLFDLSKNDKIASWDGQWVYSVWKESGLCIVPKYNLVTNIGFGEDATHTSNTSIFANMKTKDLSFPLVHPKVVMANTNLDNLEMKMRFKEAKRLPYPFDMWASKLKWFIKGLKQ